MKRLIATRWSGHYESTRHINKNFFDIVKCLNIAAKSTKLKSEDRAMAFGLLHQVKNEQFVFVNAMLMEILTPINFMVKQLQSSSENITSAISVVKSTREDLNCLRCDMDECKAKAVIDKYFDEEDMSILLGESRPQRSSKHLPKAMADFVVTESVPSEKSKRCKSSIFNECLDKIEAEFARRFSTENIQLWTSMESLSPVSQHFLDASILVLLFDYSNTIPYVRDFFGEQKLSVEDLHCECRILSRVYYGHQWARRKDGTIDVLDVYNTIQRHHEKSAIVLLKLFEVAITAGYTSTRVECLFSALTRIDSPQRRSMLSKRESELSFLAFEHEKLNDLTFEDFLVEWKCTPHRFIF